MKPFQNKVAIVTGAGQGIGLAICRQLASKGAHVLLNDREQSLAEMGAKKIREENGSCVAVVGDVADESFHQELVRQAVSQFGRLDIVIANAGITLYGDFLSYSRKDFDQVMSVNLAGSFFLAQAAAEQMKRQGEGGSMLFISSVTGHRAHKDLTAYGMSKAAVEMLAKGLVIELSQFKITVNAIAPGATLTERTGLDRDYEKTWSRITPLGKPATVEDIANAAVFLVSPAAGHVTGQSLVIDGGWTSVGPSPYE